MNILVIAHYFSPSILVGSFRPTYWANYLASHPGISVSVLTAVPSNGSDECERDRSCRVHRINSEHSVIVTRDSENWWLEAYRERLDKLLQDHSFDIAIFTAGPFFYLKLGLRLRKIHQIPYIVDFRDPWYLDERMRWRSKGGILRQIKRRIEVKRVGYLESSIVKNSLAVINVTQGLTDLYQQRYKKFSGVDFITIENGYDDSLLSDHTVTAPPPQQGKVLCVGILGKFGYYDEGHVKRLVQALVDFKSKSKVEFQLHHWGEDSDITFRIAEEHGLESTVFCQNPVSYQQGLQNIQQMSILVLNHRDRVSRGTKIYDYILINRPVLAFVHKDSEIARFLSQFSGSYIVENAVDVVEAIDDVLTAGQRHLGQDIAVDQYSRRASADKLLAYLNNRLQTKPESPCIS